MPAALWDLTDMVASLTQDSIRAMLEEPEETAAAIPPMTAVLVFEYFSPMSRVMDPEKRQEERRLEPVAERIRPQMPPAATFLEETEVALPDMFPCTFTFSMVELTTWPAMKPRAT